MAEARCVLAPSVHELQITRQALKSSSALVCIQIALGYQDRKTLPSCRIYLCVTLICKYHQRAWVYVDTEQKHFYLRHEYIISQNPIASEGTGTA